MNLPAPVILSESVFARVLGLEPEEEVLWLLVPQQLVQRVASEEMIELSPYYTAVMDRHVVVLYH